MRWKRLLTIVLTCVGVVAIALTAVVLWLALPGAPDGGRSLAFKGFVMLPGDGRILTILDYLTIDGGRLFVTNASSGTVYKLSLADPIDDIKTFALEPAAHGVVVDPVSHLGYVTRSKANTVDIFDPASMRLIKRLPVADDPDGIFYLPSARMIYVANGDAASATLIDPRLQAVTGTMALDGKPEFGAVDSQGRLFYQNLENVNAVAAIDVGTRTVESRWPLVGCDGPSGMAMDQTGRRLFIGCSGNSALVVFDLVGHRVIATVAVGSGPDSVAYDSQRHRVYVTGRSGILTVLQIQQSGPIVVLDTITLHYGAHTLAVDPIRGNLFVGYASLFSSPRLALFAFRK